MTLTNFASLHNLLPYLFIPCGATPKIKVVQPKTERPNVPTPPATAHEVWQPADSHSTPFLSKHFSLMAAFMASQCNEDRDYMLQRSAVDLIKENKTETSYTLPTLKDAIFYIYENSNATITEASEHFNIPLSSLHRHWTKWHKSCPRTEPMEAEDIEIALHEPGRRPTMTDEEEGLIVRAVKEYASMKTPLTRITLFDFVQHFFRKLTPLRQEEIRKVFKRARPGPKWMRYFLRRHPELQFKSVQVIDDRRVQAVTILTLLMHITRLNAVMERYRIRDPHLIWNVDQTGISFTKIVHRSLRKALGPASTRLIQTMVRTKGNLDHVTMMPVVSAAGDTLPPVIVYPGKLARFRKINGVYQSLHSVVPHCYLYQRDPAGVDSTVFSNWAKQFVQELSRFRAPGEYAMLILDGYSAHVSYKYR